MKTTKYNFLTLIIMLIFSVAFAHAQEKQRNVYGTVFSSDSLSPVSNTHVINKSTFAGTITNGAGEFLIQGHEGDTLVFSNISYQFYYYQITGDEGDNLIVKLKTRNYLLDEVSVSAYKLTSNDPKPMTVGKPMIPENKDIYTPQALAPTLANPVDFLYYMFSKHPKQLATLQRLYAEDAYKQKLKEGNNREILVRLTGMPREELEIFMFYCKYSDTYINTLNDYDFLISLLNCYNQYERDQAVNEILNQQDTQNKLEEQGERFKD